MISQQIIFRVQKYQRPNQNRCLNPIPDLSLSPDLNPGLIYQHGISQRSCQLGNGSYKVLLILIMMLIFMILIYLIPVCRRSQNYTVKTKRSFAISLQAPTKIGEMMRVNSPKTISATHLMNGRGNAGSMFALTMSGIL